MGETRPPAVVDADPKALPRSPTAPHYSLYDPGSERDVAQGTPCLAQQISRNHSGCCLDCRAHDCCNAAIGFVLQISSVSDALRGLPNASTEQPPAAYIAVNAVSGP